MNERQIEAFRATAHAGTVTGAARALNISQPAVSRLLSYLEQNLDIALFDRKHGRLQLTPEGAAFLEEVEQHFVGLENLRTAAHRIALHGPGSLRTIGIPSVTSGALPRAVTRLLADHPTITVTVDTDTTDRITPRVESGAYDVGFTTHPVPPSSTVETRVLVSRPWVCVFPPGHHFTGRGQIKLKELGQEPLVGFSPGMSLRERLDREFAAREVFLTYKVSAQTVESICALVARGGAGAVIHPYATHVARMHGLQTITVDEPLSLDLVVVTPPKLAKSSLVQECIEHMRRCYEEEAR